MLALLRRSKCNSERQIEAEIKMNRVVNTATNVNSQENLQNIFDHSLAVLCESKDVSPRSLPLHISAADLQKRALSDAAKALTMLWKVSEPKRVKP